MQIMTYEEFAESIRLFLLNKNATERPFFYAMGALFILLLVLFVIYLRKKYLYAKENTDTFNSDNMKGDFKYPGFHKGVTRDLHPKKNKNDKKDKWGKIEDD